MAKAQIQYRSGYKYQLAADYSVAVGIKPATDIDTEFIALGVGGDLTVKSGYAWDGPSGPVRDTTENMRASLVHDALYQLMRQRKLSAKTHKDKADRLFKKMCTEDGTSPNLAEAYYLGLKIVGKPATDPKNEKKVHVAP